MNHLFVPYELAVKLKEKGFDEPCLAIFTNEGFRMTNEPLKNSDIDNWKVMFPLYQQVVDWFEKYFIYIHTTIEVTGSDEYDHGYVIDFIPKEFQEVKRRCPHFQTIKSYKEGIGSYMGAWHTKTEAILAAIEESLNLIN